MAVAQLKLAETSGAGMDTPHHGRVPEAAVRATATVAKSSY